MSKLDERATVPLKIHPFATRCTAIPTPRKKRRDPRFAREISKKNPSSIQPLKSQRTPNANFPSSLLDSRGLVPTNSENGITQYDFRVHEMRLCDDRISSAAHYQNINTATPFRTLCANIACFPAVFEPGTCEMLLEDNSNFH